MAKKQYLHSLNTLFPLYIVNYPTKFLHIEQCLCTFLLSYQKLCILERQKNIYTQHSDIIEGKFLLKWKTKKEQNILDDDEKKKQFIYCMCIILIQLKNEWKMYTRKPTLTGENPKTENTRIQIKDYCTIWIWCDDEFFTNSQPTI